MGVRPWEATLAGTAVLALFISGWAGAVHLASDTPPPDIFGAAAVLAGEAPPVPEPPALVLGATVGRGRAPATSTGATSSTPTPGPAPTTTTSAAPSPTITTTTAAPPEPPPEPTGVVDATLDVVGGLASGLLSLL